MEPIIIKLSFSKNPSGLAGNDAGQKVYAEQIAPFLSGYNGDTSIVIVFPDYVERIAISFIQGLTKSLADQYGRSALSRMISFRTSNSVLSEKIAKDMVA